MHALAVTLLLCASAGPDDPLLGSSPGRYVVPGLEVTAYSVGMFFVVRYAMQEDYAQITPESLARNFEHGPRFDNDHIFVDFLGHPYQGAIAYGAARSAGNGFWVSSLYALGHDLAWEWLAEVQAPSTNDVVETGPASALWGEALYRTARLLLAHHEGPAALDVLRALAAFAADPFGTVNYAMLAPEDDGSEQVRFRARLYGGTLTWPGPHARTQALFGGDLVYGAPDAPGSAWVEPFDFFEARGAGAVGGTSTAELEVLGALAGRGFGAHGPPGLVGLFGLTDFGTGRDFRWASTAAGPGALAQARLGRWELRATGVAALVLMGASGSAAQTDYVEPNDTVPGESKYSMGPGFLARLELDASWANRLDLTAEARTTWLGALTPATGLERADQLRLGAAARLPWHLLFGGELALADRSPARPADPAQWGWSVRAFAGLHFGE